jgi:hypothetical protein
MKVSITNDHFKSCSPVKLQYFLTGEGIKKYRIGWGRICKLHRLQIEVMSSIPRKENAGTLFIYV